MRYVFILNHDVILSTAFKPTNNNGRNRKLHFKIPEHFQHTNFNTQYSWKEENSPQTDITSDGVSLFISWKSSRSFISCWISFLFAMFVVSAPISLRIFGSLKGKNLRFNCVWIHFFFVHCINLFCLFCFCVAWTGTRTRTRWRQTFTNFSLPGGKTSA